MDNRAMYGRIVMHNILVRHGSCLSLSCFSENFWQLPKSPKKNSSACCLFRFFKLTHDRSFLTRDLVVVVHTMTAVSQDMTLQHKCSRRGWLDGACDFDTGDQAKLNSTVTTEISDSLWNIHRGCFGCH